MSANLRIPIPQGLLDAVVYDPTSPTFLRWREGGRGRRRDLQAGRLRATGYHALSFGPRGDNRQYLHHRVIWALHHGDPGGLVVDHIDNDPTNNRIENLQAINQKENNARKAGRGCRQVSSGKWVAEIKEDQQTRHLGTFATEEEARAAYEEAKALAAKGLSPQLEEFRHDS